MRQPDKARTVIQIAGALMGLLGAGSLLEGSVNLITTRSWEDFLLGLVVALYLFYVGFLAWKRFSPLAIKHLCAVISFLCLTLPHIVLEPLFPRWVSMISDLVLLYPVILLYRRNAGYFIRQIFGDQELQSPKTTCL